MAIHKGTVEAISYKYEKFAVLIEEKWYNTKAEYAAEWPVKPAVGDVITFDDGGKKYLGKMKIVSSPGGSAGTAKAASGGYSNIGVEVGHASNLAMRVMEQRLTEGSGLAYTEVGTAEYYKLFIKETETIYKLMKGLKAKLGEPKVAEKPEEPVPAKKAATEEADLDDLEDLF